MKYSDATTKAIKSLANIVETNERFGILVVDIISKPTKLVRLCRYLIKNCSVAKTQILYGNVRVYLDYGNFYVYYLGESTSIKDCDGLLHFLYKNKIGGIS